MRDKLRVIAHKAAADPDHHPDFTLSYLRGHALSGTTRVTVTAAGAYTLDSNVTQGRQPFSHQGQLATADRDAVLRLIDDNDLLATPPSTRNIGDDEEPVVIEVSEGAQRYQLMIWHGDGVKDVRFHAFEGGLLAVVRRLSDGAVMTSADY